MATNIGTGPQDIPLNQFLGEMAFQDKAPIVGVGSRVTNPNTTSVEWLYLPPNTQTIDIGTDDAWNNTMNSETTRMVIQLGTSSGYITSSVYNNRSWNMFTGGIGFGFNTTKSGFIPFYWIDNTDRETGMFQLRRLGTTNTWHCNWNFFVSNGHNYITLGAGYVDLGAEITSIRFTTIPGTPLLNGSYWMNYLTR